MKNQYVADINDYRKYGLLRALAADGAIRTGICWMLTPGDGRSDGRFIRYLDDPGRWDLYDASLFDGLASCVRSGQRCVQQIETSAVLPGAVFHSDVLGDSADDRARYFAKMRERFRGVDLVFFDPDNGLEVQSRRYGRKNSSKYLYWSELVETYDAGSSVLVYQHFVREKREGFIDRIAVEMAVRTNAAAVWSFRTSHVVFFLAAQPAHLEIFERQAVAVRHAWANQIEVSEHPLP